MVFLFVFLFSVSSFAQPIDFSPVYRSIYVNGALEDSDSEAFDQDLEYARLIAPGSSRIYFSRKDEKQSFKSNPLPDNLSTISDAITYTTANRPKVPEAAFVYFTDHGGKENDKAFVKLGEWGYDNQAVQDMITDVQNQGTKKVIVVNDYCHSGGMNSVIFKNIDDPDSMETIPGVCGMSASDANEYAYTTESFMAVVNKKLKEAPHEIDTDKDGLLSFREAFDYFERSYKTTSTPFSTSDAFLKRYYDRELRLRKSYLKGGRKDLKTIFEDYQTCSKPGLPNNIDDHRTRLQKFMASRYYDNLKKDLHNHYNKFQWANDETTIDQVEKKVIQYEGEIAALEEKKTKAEYAKAKILYNDFPQIEELNNIDNLITNKEIEATILRNQALNSITTLPAVDFNDQDQVDRYLKDHPELSGAVAWRAAFEEKKKLIEKRSSLLEQYDTYVEKMKNSSQVNNLNKVIDNAETQYQFKNKQISGLRRLYKTIYKANALKTMIDNQDSENISRFLDVIECENTILRKL